MPNPVVPAPLVPLAENTPTMRLWPDVGRDVLHMSKDSCYEAAHRGQIPVVRLGRKLLVPTQALRNMLHLDGPAHVLVAPVDGGAA